MLYPAKEGGNIMIKFKVLKGIQKMDLSERSSALKLRTHERKGAD
jgi:hypothetical protein